MKDILTKLLIIHILNYLYVGPIILTKERDNLWRICVENKIINKITMKYEFSILRVKIWCII